MRKEFEKPLQAFLQKSSNDSALITAITKPSDIKLQ